MSANEKPRRRTRFYTSSLIWDAPLRPADIAVFTFLSWCADAEGRSFPSVAEIARRCGMSDNTVRASIRRLKEKKLITVTPQMLTTPGGRNRQTSNLYLLPTDNAPRARCGTPLHPVRYPPSQDGEQINNININGRISVCPSLSNYSVGNEGGNIEGKTELCVKDALSADTVTEACFEEERSVPDQDRAPERGTRPCSDSAGSGKTPHPDSAGSGTSPCFAGANGANAIEAERRSPEARPAEYFAGMSFYDPPGRLPDADVFASPPELPEVEDGEPSVFGIYPPPPLGAEEALAPRDASSPKGEKSQADKGENEEKKSGLIFTPAMLDQFNSDMRLEELIYKLELYLYDDRTFADAVELTLRDMWDAEYTVINGNRIPRDKVRDRLERLNISCIDNVCRALEKYEDVTCVSRYLAVCLFNAPRDAAADFAGFKRSMGYV